MNRYVLFVIVLAAVIPGVLLGAGSGDGLGPAVTPATGPPSAQAQTEGPSNAATTTGQAPNFFWNWRSVNNGGEHQATSTNLTMGITIGQVVAGSATSANLDLGLGFWHGAASACPIAITGDVNESGTLTSADIIALVNFTFKGGAPPAPCEAAGDVNCSGSVTSADIIYMVNHVFKGAAAPCDACSLIPGTWSC
jgi:hypothetical protein